MSSYKNKQILKDEYGVEIVMFFNENFIKEIVPLISAYRNSKLCKTNKEKKLVNYNGIVSIKKTINFFKNNFKFNAVEFVEYGQRRRKYWDYMTIEKYESASNIMPKPKKKFINPKNRKRYVISK